LYVGSQLSYKRQVLIDYVNKSEMEEYFHIHFFHFM